MPFKKGDPGGPGRPKQKPFIDWCGKWTADKAEQFLAPLAEDSGSKFQFEAIKLIMAYGVGKPIETQVLEANVTASSGSGVEDLKREIADALGEPEDKGGRVDSKTKVDSGK